MSKKDIETNASQERTPEWRPAPSYRKFGFDLKVLALGKNQGVDGRRVISTGALNRFATDLTKLTTTQDWEILNQQIARRWRELAKTDAGHYRIILPPEVSCAGTLVAVEITLARGSDLSFADRTLTSITAFEIARPQPNWFVRLFRMLLGNRNAA